MLTLDQIDIINRIAEVAASGWFLTDEQDGAMAAVDEIQQQMKQPITRQALLDAGWTAQHRDMEYIYGKSIGPVVASPPLGKHLFYVRWDLENKDILREIGCIEDTGEFSDETVHATNIHNMYELMLWVRLTGESS